MGDRKAWALFSVCVAVGIASIDNSILNVALPTLSRSVGATNSQLQWIVDAYTLVFASLLLTAGSLGDRYGRRRMFILGLALFGTGSGVAALSTSASTLILCRATMGIGGACLSPASLSLLSNVFPDQRERARAIGIWAATASVGVAVGPVAGGLLLQHFWWGSVFLVNVPIAAVLIVLSPWALPESKHPDSAFVDPLGVVLSVVTLTSLLWATIEGAGRGWTDPLILGAAVASVVFGTLFVKWELHNPRPMLDLRLFADGRFAGASAVASISMFTGAGALFVVGQLLQFGLGLSALQTGLRMAPMAATMASAAVLSIKAAARWGNRKVVAVGLALFVISSLMWMMIDEHSGFGPLLAIMLVYGLGQGLVFAPCMAAAMGAAPSEKSGAASGTINTLRQTGLALGIAVLGTVLSSSFNRGLRSRVGGLGLSAEQVNTAASSTGDAFKLAGSLGGGAGRGLGEAARTAYIHAGIVTMLVSAAVGVLAFAVNQRFVPAHGPRATSDEGLEPAGFVMEPPHF
ncbi:MAG: transporter [Acidimicrobiia bacterium]|nr:transporter [Acidimicrobiia bacterium]